MDQNQFDTILKEILPAGKTVLLAVSGGRDSMCMADLFLNSALKVPFAIAHCNFHLRGKESDSDEKLVHSWAEEHRIKFFKSDFNTKAYASMHSVSIEMAARDMRYDWFAYLCSTQEFGSVAVAHNANDNAETLMLNILRGTGAKGMCGMGEASLLHSDRDGATLLIRPLLHFTRTEITEYVSGQGIPYHDDSTNAMNDVKRNKIRNLVFPVFAEMNPSFVETVNRDIRFFSQVCQIADIYFETQKEKVVDSDNPLRINVSHLKEVSSWQYILYRLLEPYNFEYPVIEDLCRSLKSGDPIGGKLFESSRYVLVAGADQLVLTDKMDKTFKFKPLSINESEQIMAIRGLGQYLLGGHNLAISCEESVKDFAHRQPDWIISVDAARLTFPFIVRRWKAGDWFVPFGSKGKKKISDFFSDLKFNLLDKQASLVIVRPGENDQTQAETEHVAAVLGYRGGKPLFRIDDSLKITSSTEKVLILKDLL